MKSIAKVLLLLFVAGSVTAEPKKEMSGEFPIEEIIGVYASASGEKVIVDPRVKGRIRVYGQSLEELSYDNLSTMLSVHNFTAFRSDGYLIVIPQNIAKQQSIGLVTEGQQYALNQIVSDLIALDKLCPNDLVPLLRPLLPPTSHFALMKAPRSLFITDTYGNTLRIRQIIERLNSRLDKAQSCKQPNRKS